MSGSDTALELDIEPNFKRELERSHAGLAGMWRGKGLRSDNSSGFFAVCISLIECVWLCHHEQSHPPSGQHRPAHTSTAVPQPHVC